MKEEVLRLNRVTCIEQGVTELNHFSLNVFAGEIMGLLPVNGTGLQALLRRLRQNLPIHYGYIYYREKLVNHWRHSDGSFNRVGMIESRSGLAQDLTVADNVFVLRHGFQKRVISRGVLRRQLEPFMRDIGMEISADAYVRDLTVFQCFVVELVRALVAGNRLVILTDAGAVISDEELHKLFGILRRYAQKGISFLYISQHYEEIRQVCDRAALMVNGQIAKVLSTADTPPELIHCFGVESYEKLVREQAPKKPPALHPVAAMEIHDLFKGGINGLTLSIAPGECVVMQDMDSLFLDDFLSLISGESKPDRGSIRIAGRELGYQNRRDVAVIQKLAIQSMLFPELSYLDNLCFTMDHRLSGVWLSSRARQSIRREYEEWLGADVFDKSVGELTNAQKYDLIYARILLQRPRVAFCIQPFMQADVPRRMQIWKLLERLLEKDIAVVIPAVNLADSLSLANRLIRIRDGRVQASYERSEFSSLPESTPWRHLWDQHRQPLQHS